MDVETQPQQPPRKVSWGAVIGGMFLAWFLGIFASVGAIAGSVTLFDMREALAVVVATAAVALFYLAIWWFTSRVARDLAMGLLIGGCMVAIATGACGALMMGLSNMH